MRPIYHYATVSKAIDDLRLKGFTEDFNLEANCLVCASGKFNDTEFEISHMYYYEGETDPADRATVYGIESKTGVKGVLVTGEDSNTDPMSEAIVQKLLVHRNDLNT